MNIEETLKQIGLTSSEIKVYLALLKIGTATKGPIVEQAKIAPSKIYDVLGKLIDKGLVSFIIKNNVKNYSCAPLNRIKDYLKDKKKEIEKEEESIDKLLPMLASFQNSESKTTAEIFIGWKGMETAYSSVLERIKQGENAYILGASSGSNVKRTENFFYKYSKIARIKKINLKMILNEDSREYISKMERELGFKFNKKFMQKKTNMEIAIGPDAIGIVILKEEPVAILIKDEESARSFVTYFEELWKISKS
jgi:sugar-specific transcriptional regulator TrmB